MFDSNPKTEFDESQLHKYEILSILKGNLEPLQSYQDDFIYKNIDYKLSEHPNLSVAKLIKLQ